LIIRVGSRQSALSVKQAEIVIDGIKRYNPSVEIELITMKTSGDTVSDRRFKAEGGKGLFVKELEQALLEGRIDIAVHSYKDVPARVDARAPIVAVSAREDARDALVLPPGADKPDPAGPIGCSGLRRQLQAAELFPGADIRPIRGNVLTRLAKLDGGEYSALILAVAGLKRLGLEARANRVFGPDEILPAACQGVLAVQALRGFDVSVLSALHDAAAWDTSTAERAFTSALNADCSSPIAAYGTLEADILTLKCFFRDENGKIHRHMISGGRETAARLGEKLAAMCI